MAYGTLAADQIRAGKRLSKTHKLLLAGAKLSSSLTETANIEPLLNKAISNMSQLDVLYSNGSIIQKRKIIGLVSQKN